MGSRSRAYSVFLTIKGQDQFTGTFKKAAKGLGSLRSFALSPLKVFDQLGSSVGGFLEKVPGLAILGRTAMRVGGELKSMALDASDFGSKFNDLSVQSGIGTRALQEVAYAADQAGVPFDQFQAGLQKMTATLGRGVSGRQLFATLGKGATAFVNAMKKAKTPGAKFEAVLSQMAAIPEATKRAAFGMQFFGRAGVKLAALAGDGADGIKRMREEAAQLGLVMSDDEIKRADEFGDTWAALGKVFESGKRDFGTGLIEGLLPGMGALLKSVKANRKEIGLMLKDWGRKVAGGIVDGVEWLKGAFVWTKDAVLWLGDFGIPAIGAALTVLSGNPFFLALAVAYETMKWLLEHTPGAESKAQKADTRAKAVAEQGYTGGLMASFGSANAGKGVVGFGLADAIFSTADYAVNADKRNAEDATTNYNTTVALANAWQAMPNADEALMYSQQSQSFEIIVDINAPEGVVDGKPDVKAPPGTKTKSTVLNKGPRMTLKGGG